MKDLNSKLAQAVLGVVVLALCALPAYYTRTVKLEVLAEVQAVRGELATTRVGIENTLLRKQIDDLKELARDWKEIRDAVAAQDRRLAVLEARPR